MNARLKALASYSSHPHYKRLLARLKQPQLDQIEGFIRANSQLGHLDFEYAVNRMHLDKGLSDREKKTAAIVQEILTSVNSAVYVGGK